MHFLPLNSWCKLRYYCQDLSGYRERVLHLNKPSSKQTRALLHLELTSWVGPELPASPAPLILAAQHIQELHNQQRSVTKPVLIHCRDGGNKSGTVCALVSALAEVEVIKSLNPINIYFNNNPMKPILYFRTLDVFQIFYRYFHPYSREGKEFYGINNI